VSTAALCWTFNLAPVPTDKNGKPNSACAFVLAGLAKHAHADGRNAIPGVATLVRYTRLCERTVRVALDRLAAARIIVPGDPDIAAALIRRGDRRPQIWDLNLDLVRDDLTEDDLDAIARSDALLRPLIDRYRARRAAAAAAAAAAEDTDTEDDVPPPDDVVHTDDAQAVSSQDTDGVQPLPPAVDNEGAQVQPLHPVGADGVQPATPRGASAAPEHSFEPSQTTTAAGRASRPSAQCAPRPGSSRTTPVDEDRIAEAIDVLRSLPAPWTPNRGTCVRFAGLVAARLAAGWTPEGLVAALTPESPVGVHNPVGLIVTRLRDLAPTPPRRYTPEAMPPWCGDMENRGCSDRYRWIDDDQGLPMKCPHCHPVVRVLAAVC
jgi:hypothetical protein